MQQRECGYYTATLVLIPPFLPFYNSLSIINFCRTLANNMDSVACIKRVSTASGREAERDQADDCERKAVVRYLSEVEGFPRQGSGAAG